MATNNAINNAAGQLTIDPGSSGDSFVQFDLNTTGKYRIGVDDSDSDSFKIALGSALGTNDSFVMTSAGERTMPLQPAFLAIVTSTISNVTGDGTAYTVAYDTEVFDQNSDFSSTTFTAPVTGRYLFQTNVLTGGLTSSTNVGLYFLTTSNVNYLYKQGNPYAARETTLLNYELGASVLSDMDAADTAHTVVQISGGTKVVDVESGGAAFPCSWFSGCLMV